MRNLLHKTAYLYGATLNFEGAEVAFDGAHFINCTIRADQKTTGVIVNCDFTNTEFFYDGNQVSGSEWFRLVSRDKVQP